jgi:hypothetical protein
MTGGGRIWRPCFKIASETVKYSPKCRGIRTIYVVLDVRLFIGHCMYTYDVYHFHQSCRFFNEFTVSGATGTMQLLTVAISSKNFGGATPQPQIPTVCCLVYPPVPPTFLLPLSTLPLLFHASILITSKSHIHYAKALLLRSVVARRRFTVRSDCCCFLSAFVDV